MEKTPLKFRKYTNKEDFNIARWNNEISEGDITFVSETKEVFVGPNTKYVKHSNNKDGAVIVDKIFHGSRAILSDRVSVGYRYGIRNNQKVYVALAELYHRKHDVGYCRRYVIDPQSNLLYGTDHRYFTWDNHINITHFDNFNIYTWHLNVHDNPDVFFGSTNWWGMDTSSEKFFNYFSNINEIEHMLTKGTQGYSYKYVALFKEYGKTGYYEKTKDGWKFYYCNWMIGNHGVIEIKNNKIISKSLAYNISNQYLTYDAFYSLLEGIELDYRSHINLKTQTTYSLYVKLRNKKTRCHKDCPNKVHKKWFKVWNNQRGIGQKLYSYNLDKIINFYPLYKGIFPWNMRIQNRLPGKTLYKYNKETNQIDKYFVVKYLDFKVGKHGNKKYGPDEDEHCISFRAYFNPKGVNIEIKNRHELA